MPAPIVKPLQVVGEPGPVSATSIAGARAAALAGGPSAGDAGEVGSSATGGKMNERGAAPGCGSVAPTGAMNEPRPAAASSTNFEILMRSLLERFPWIDLASRPTDCWSTPPPHLANAGYRLRAAT